MPPSQDQVRITVWIDKDIYAAFQKMHPQQGATTAFVRRWFESYLKRIDKGLEHLLEEKP